MDHDEFWKQVLSGAHTFIEVKGAKVRRRVD
jgi:hypothetical protein